MGQTIKVWSVYGHEKGKKQVKHLGHWKALRGDIAKERARSHYGSQYIITKALVYRGSLADYPM